MSSRANVIDCAGKVHMARGVEAGRLQDASERHLRYRDYVYEHCQPRITAVWSSIPPVVCKTDRWRAAKLSGAKDVT